MVLLFRFEYSYVVSLCGEINVSMFQQSCNFLKWSVWLLYDKAGFETFTKHAALMSKKKFQCCFTLKWTTFY